jgi:purine-cytosine permease-like protein
MAPVRLGKRKINIPGTPAIRIVIGLLLVVFGIFGFLPFLGFWMLPLGVVVLSVDLHPVRRFRRRFEVWWGRRRQRKRAEGRAVGSRQLPSSIDPE